MSDEIKITDLASLYAAAVNLDLIEKSEIGSYSLEDIDEIAESLLHYDRETRSAWIQLRDTLRKR